MRIRRPKVSTIAATTMVLTVAAGFVIVQVYGGVKNLPSLLGVTSFGVSMLGWIICGESKLSQRIGQWFIAAAAPVAIAACIMTDWTRLF